MSVFVYSLHVLAVQNVVRYRDSSISCLLVNKPRSDLAAYPIAPGGRRRRCTCDIRIGGLRIPGKTLRGYSIRSGGKFRWALARVVLRSKP